MRADEAVREQVQAQVDVGASTGAAAGGDGGAHRDLGAHAAVLVGADQGLQLGGNRARGRVGGQRRRGEPGVQDSSVGGDGRDADARCRSHVGQGYCSAARIKDLSCSPRPRRHGEGLGPVLRCPAQKVTD